MRDTMVIDDGETVLARIDIEVHGHARARAAAIAAANELATPERPLQVRLEWWLGGEVSSNVVHLAMTAL
jgi:hypothetical protein